MSSETTLILDVEENPTQPYQWVLFPVQHVLAMLVACITVPMLTNLPIAATLVSAGIGTLCYVFATKRKSPVFLSSSFAYIGAMTSALSLHMRDNQEGLNYLALILGMILVGLVYITVAVLIKFVGMKWLDKLLPPIIVGPVIMVIGLSLAGSAISNLTTVHSIYNWAGIASGLVAMFTTILASHYGRGMIALIPFVVGMSAGYIFALLMTAIGYAADYYPLKVVNFDPFTNIFGKDTFSGASIFNYKMFKPNDPESFIFFRFDQISKFDWAEFPTVMLLFIPLSLVTICEHIGDHKNLGNIINRDLLGGEPGMHRTLTGDGLATAVSGVLCGAANTTYGENVAVVGTTGIASINVVIIAAILSIFVGFFTPFTALLETIPNCVTGGISLVLYGFIASSGIKMLIHEQLDLNQSRNIFVVSVILVSGIGGFAWKFGDSDDPEVQITSTAVSMIMGIVVNLILVPKKQEQAEPSSQAAESVELETVAESADSGESSV